MTMKTFRIIYVDNSTEVVKFKKKSQVYAYLRRIKVYNTVFNRLVTRYKQVEEVYE